MSAALYIHILVSRGARARVRLKPDLGVTRAPEHVAHAAPRAHRFLDPLLRDVQNWSRGTAQPLFNLHFLFFLVEGPACRGPYHRARVPEGCLDTTLCVVLGTGGGSHEALRRLKRRSNSSLRQSHVAGAPLCATTQTITSLCHVKQSRERVSHTVYACVLHLWWPGPERSKNYQVCWAVATAANAAFLLLRAEGLGFSSGDQY